MLSFKPLGNILDAIGGGIEHAAGDVGHFFNNTSGPQPTPAPQQAPPTANTPIQIGRVPVQPQPLPAGTQSSVTPLSIAQSFPRAAAEIPASAFSKTYHPGPGVQQAIFGKAPIQPVQQDVRGVYRAVKAGHQDLPGGIPISPSLATPYAVADAAFHVLNDVPLAAVAVKGAKAIAKGIEAPASVAARAVDTAATTPKAAVALKQAGQNAASAAPKSDFVSKTTAAPTADQVASVKVPKQPVTAPPVPKANTGLPEVDKAINDVADKYTQQNQFTGGVQDVVDQAVGKSQTGIRVANTLRKALTKNLTSDENHAINAFLDGETDPGLTPRAFKVANALRPLYDQAHGVRSAIDDSVGRLTNYSPRILINRIASGVKDASGNVLNKIKSLADVNNLNSGFSKNRQVGKFVSKDDVLYGRSSQVGLTRHQDGTITNAQGKVYKYQDIGKHEVEANTNYRYEHNEAKVAGVYHGDTLSLKVRGEAVQALADNPARHGLYTKEQLAAGEGPSDAAPVDRVAGLKDKDGLPLYAAKADAKFLNDKLGYQNRVGLAGKTYDAVSNAATQFIVLNPFFHGMNQLFQTAIAAGNLPGIGNGWLELAKGVTHVSEDDIRAYLDAGGHIPTYGSDVSNLLSKATGGATKVSSKTMVAIETRLRVGLYKASLAKDMSPAKALKNIDTFLGDSKAIDPTVRRLTLFAHYFKTMAKAVGTQAAHPVENIGSIGNAATLAALTAAVSYGYAKFTGNPNAKVRVPGELGLVQEAYDTVHGVASGGGVQAAGAVVNHINPVAKEVGQQTFNHDLYSGQTIGDTKARVEHAVSGLVAPSQTVGRVASGSRSLAETAANQLGLSTPHARGYQAAPNLSFLNTPKSIVSKTGDPTGYKQQQSYFQNLGALKKQFAGADTATTDALNKYLDRSHDPTTGQAIKNSPADTVENAGALATNDKLRTAVQKFEQSQPSHDPMWDLTPDKLQYLMTYKAQLEGSAERNVLKANATGPKGTNWISNLETAQQGFYNNLPKTPGGKPSETNQATPAYPSFDPHTTNLLAAYNQATPDQRSQLIKDNPGELATAFNAIAQWTNNMRKAQTGKDTPQLNIYPEADPKTQAILNIYNALPKGNGKNGGSPTRAAWIKANPDAYAQMQNYLTQTSMYSLVKNAALAQFQGTTASQQLLKDIKNVGQFDIATTKNADGSTGYALNPAAAFQQSSSSSSGSNTAAKIIANEKLHTAAREADHAAKAAKRATAKNFSRPHQSKVFIKGTPNVTKQKITLAGVGRHYTPSVKAKAAPTGNKVKLKI